jgi:phenylalanyl-tRNA synthetase beta chain
MGITDTQKFITYEFDIQLIYKVHKPIKKYAPPAKFPAQIEDITLILPDRTRVGNLIEAVIKHDKNIAQFELADVFKSAYTFRVWYQNSQKTLNNSDVEKIRNSIVSFIKNKFGATVK